jgi:hypothetical protein
MKSKLRSLLALALFTGALFALSGCQSTTEDSSVPWNRPADWEGQVPGMGRGF